MKPSNTKYSAIAAYLTQHPNIIVTAKSYQDLTTLINKHFGTHIKSSTISIIVASLHGAKQQQPQQQQPLRLELSDSFNNKSWLTITSDKVTLNNHHTSLSLSNLRYKGDIHYDLRDLFKREQYLQIITLINKETVHYVINVPKLY